MKLDRDLQRAGARYANAKADEIYLYMILTVGLIVVIGVMAYQLIGSTRYVFGI